MSREIQKLWNCLKSKKTNEEVTLKMLGIDDENKH